MRQLDAVGVRDLADLIDQTKNIIHWFVERPVPNNTLQSAIDAAQKSFTEVVKKATGLPREYVVELNNFFNFDKDSLKPQPRIPYQIELPVSYQKDIIAFPVPEAHSGITVAVLTKSKAFAELEQLTERTALDGTNGQERYRVFNVNKTGSGVYHVEFFEPHFDSLIRTYYGETLRKCSDALECISRKIAVYRKTAV